MIDLPLNIPIIFLIITNQNLRKLKKMPLFLEEDFEQALLVRDKE
nr:MAG TPA: hypothetical protein [Caudoviricetes sp.]